MSIVSRLRHHFPSNWEYVGDTQYDKDKYALCKVANGSSEYTLITAPFLSITETMNVHRVQYPAAYLRFKMKSELESDGGIRSQHLLINRTNLDITLLFNCDPRRDGVGSLIAQSTIVESINSTSSPKTKAIVILEQRDSGKFDDDKYPTYIITFGSDESDDSILVSQMRSLAMA